MIDVQTVERCAERAPGLAAAARLIHTLGRNEFAEETFATIDADVAIDYLSMFRIGQNGGIEVLSAAARFKRVDLRAIDP